MNLSNLVIEAASWNPAAIAIQSPDEDLTYGELDALANQIARALAKLGVQCGSRVGIWLNKSVRAIAVMQGVLRLGAAYVPIDPLSPVVRASIIIHDCQLSALVTSKAMAEQVLKGDLANLACFTIDEPLHSLSWRNLASFSNERFESPVQDADELAYILYTSGSTGKPKGVCISHRNAMAFIRWAAEELKAQPTDRFSNHAPFHFDLSVLDIYVAFLAGACVYIIPEGMAYIPQRLVSLLVRESITVWYSVPSALILMMQHGRLFEAQNLALRAVLFAGESFPIKYLRRLRQYWSSIKLLNLYGPTETNVCTYYEVHDISPERKEPVPIGQACCGNRIWAVKDDGTVAKADEEGELMVSGPTVMIGYWRQPQQGNKPYATGDIVRLQSDGNYLYIGRRDHLVKVRGFRVEIGEIEATLLLHSNLSESAVIVTGQGSEAYLVAFLVSHVNPPPSLLKVKQHCALHLPRYMIVDKIRYVQALPRTRNGKIDRGELQSRAKQLMG
ncbi:MAG: amino acid adenylation domain-containing protein [Symploca sp. SIO2D2]|nr:amino acid adenylation domain-containing protein [Symploca sp. SIO2D2]